jgi:DNA-binding HxlR family transcriptional regulator
MSQTKSSRSGLAQRTFRWDGVVQRVLADGPLTNKDIRLQLGISRRSLYAVLRRLSTLGVVGCSVNLRDTRQRYYWLKARAADPRVTT